MIVFFPKNLKELSLFYLANDFIGGTILLNDRSVGKRSKYKWKINDNFENEQNIFLQLKKTNETGRLRTMNEQKEKR